MPPGAAPCCPPAAGSKTPTLNSEQSPLDSDLAEFLDRNDQTDIDLSNLGDFNDHSYIPPEMHYPDTDPFGLSFAEIDQLPPESSFASFSGSAFDGASQAPAGDSPEDSRKDDCCGWTMGASGSGLDVTATRLAEERQQLLSSHGLTSEEVESELALLPFLGESSKQTDHHLGAARADSSLQGESSSHSVGSGRTTITIDDISSETLLEVMQVLIKAKAKVRFETE